MTLGAPKSVIASVNTTNAALMRPYRQPGRVTVRKILRRLARSATAASYNRESAMDSEAIRMMIACGRVKNTSAITMPIGP